MEEPSHKLNLLDRKKLTMTGVEEVVSFDESAVTLHTCLGQLQVRGQNLKLKNLTLEGGQIQVDGSISELSYEEPREHTGWLSWLLR